MDKKLSFTQECWIRQLSCKINLERNKQQKLDILDNIEQCSESIDRILFNCIFSNTQKHDLISKHLKNYQSFQESLNKIEKNIHIYYGIILNYESLMKTEWMDIFW